MQYSTLFTAALVLLAGCDALSSSNNNNQHLRLANLVNQLSSTGSISKNVRPQDLSQKSVVRKNNPFMAVTRREPIRMPSQTPMVPYKPPGSDYTQFISINSAMYRDRTVMMNKFITDETANEFIAIMLYLRKEDSRAPISLYFNCPGGWLRPSLAIYDLIQNTKATCRIETINLALCGGMGAMLCAAGTKGHRSAMPNARFMMQRTGMDEVFRGQATDIALEVKNIKKWNDKMEKELALLTGQEFDRIHKDLSRDFYLTSDEAVRYGLIDSVMLPSPRKRATTTKDADLGAFEGAGEDQKYQGKAAQSGGGWGSRSPSSPTPPPPKKKDDDDEPKIAKG